MREQAEADGEEYKRPATPKPKAELEPKPYLTRPVKFVVCLNTLG